MSTERPHPTFFRSQPDLYAFNGQQVVINAKKIQTVFIGVVLHGSAHLFCEISSERRLTFIVSSRAALIFAGQRVTVMGGIGLKPFVTDLFPIVQYLVLPGFASLHPGYAGC